ncbi:Sodium/hydrogen exchanger 4, variant 4 [Lathyrus oleraceus]|uniref:Sodium/hydrogen exchanger 4, variant 4 n=1 Tax=Pisum sativum TaxID=3888 RepID=A0A9D4WU46_PEA|nr:Sodium/hydrogen exchanger 4, variant 4 [Pisum sativum]
MLFGVVGVFISTSIITVGSWWLFPKLGFPSLTALDYLALGVIFSSTDTVCTLQVLNQEATPLLYSLVFGEGVVNDATSVVLFNAVQKLDVSRLDGKAFRVIGDFLYLFAASTALGVILPINSLVSRSHYARSLFLGIPVYFDEFLFMQAGLVTAYILKALTFGKHSNVREISMMMLMAYLSYMLAVLGKVTQKQTPKTRSADK